MCLPAGGPNLVLADADKVRPILLNLVGNAIKFTEHREVCIRLEPEPATGVLQVRVSDTGIGIRPEHQGRLFQPFVQAEPDVARRYDGTGLGLSISRRLAERMGGSVSLFSAGAGLGSIFTLTVPVAPGAATEPPRHLGQS
jgi:signal transduction histidine kinase